MEKKTIYVIIPAAGKGLRMGGPVPKLLLEVAGIPVIARTLMAFDRSETAEYKMVIVTSSELRPTIKDLVEKYSITSVIGYAEGGATRTDSVSSGVRFLEENGVSGEDIVFVHDGARCLVDEDILGASAKSMSSYDVSVASIPVKNTLKITEVNANDDLVVKSTPDRDTIREVQTPQCFKFEVLKKCYGYAAEKGISATDDTALAEMLGIPVCITEGSYSNIKITTAEDIPVAEEIIRRREG